MLIKITLFITLVCYSIISSQSFFYMLALSGATKRMKAPTYIEIRQLVDRELLQKLKLMYYITFAVCLLLISFSVVNPAGLLFICSVIAFAALVIDILLALRGNMPMNRIINQWTASDYPDNWQQYRSRWFSIYHIRQAANLTGFTALLLGLVFGL